MNQDGPTYETVRVLKRERVVLSDSVGSVGFLADLPLTLRSVPNAVSASFQLPLLLPLTVSHEFSVAVSPILPTSSTVLPFMFPVNVKPV
eukprot:scaffold2296_cov133-Chaetoceros_neogracile.AAC.1